MQSRQLPNACFASVFSRPQASQSLDIREEACRKEDLSLLQEDQIGDHLIKLDTHKSTGSNGMHP